MAGQHQRKALVVAAVTDVCDGLVRLVVDAQRFGFALSALTTGAPAHSGTSISMTLLVDHGFDCAGLEARFGRHPTVKTVQVTALESEPPERET